jgi:ribonucleotide monophosphatase NagD (HAD superfamily)
MAKPKFAVAFDIDGVLTRTPNPIPGAKEVGLAIGVTSVKNKALL